MLGVDYVFGFRKRFPLFFWVANFFEKKAKANVA
jgi:hypothetical protein